MNTCGTCTVCCYIFKIEELSKPAHKACQHCTGSGCGNYENRPDTCIDFKCLYLTNGWPTMYRPDKLGLVLSKRSDHIEALQVRPKINKKKKEKLTKMIAAKGHDVIVKNIYKKTG